MPRPRSDIEPRVVEAAAERFLREGVDGASLRAIARDAETSIGMIYYYFPTKDDLFLAVLEDTYRGLLADFERILDPGLPPAQRIDGLFARAAAMTPREFRIIRIILREALGNAERLGRIIERFSRGHVPLVISSVVDGIRAGLFDPRLPLPGLLMSVAALAGVPQIVHRLVTAEAPQLAGPLPDPTVLAETAKRILLQGAAPDDD